MEIIKSGGIVDKTINGIQSPVLKLGDLDNDNDLDLIYGSQEERQGFGATNLMVKRIKRQ